MQTAGMTVRQTDELTAQLRAAIESLCPARGAVGLRQAGVEAEGTKV
jgi:hypothetical protein